MYLNTANDDKTHMVMHLSIMYTFKKVSLEMLSLLQMSLLDQHSKLKQVAALKKESAQQVGPAIK